MSKRDNFSRDIVRKLAERVRFTCSNPECKKPTIGPAIRSIEDVSYIGIAAHICAAAKGGPRYDPNQASEERSGISNAIHLCTNCATMIDKNNGTDYSVPLLKEWKKQAENTSSREHYESRVVSNPWKEVNFDNLETDISCAIFGVGLNQKHVNICPRFEKSITAVKQYLDSINECCLYGLNGSGKSITAYQIAFDYFNDGYLVYKFNEECSDAELAIPIRDKVFLIIDNAHLFPRAVIESIIEKTNNKVKALFISSSVFYELKEDVFGQQFIDRTTNPLKDLKLGSVDLDLKDALYKIKEHYLSQLSNLFQIVKKLDSRIGETVMDTPIERRIERSYKSAKTPWEFNFLIRGGWQSAKEEFIGICNKDRVDIVAMAIAFEQIFSSDKGITLEDLFLSCCDYNSDRDWFNDSLTLLNEKGLIVLEGRYIKLKHMEYARRYLVNYDKEQDKEVNKFIVSLMKKYMQRLDNKKGLYILLVCLWDLHNRYSWFLKQCEVEISNIIDHCFQHYKDEYDIYLYEWLLRPSSDSSGESYLIPYIDKVNEWLEKVDVDTALPLSNLLNSINNIEKGRYNNLIIIQESLLGELSTRILNLELNRELYVICKYVDRLLLFLSADQGDLLFSKIIIKQYSINKLEEFASYCKLLLILRQDKGFESIEVNLKQIASIFNEDCIETFKEFQEVSWLVLGSGPFDFRSNKEQIKMARKIIKSFDTSLMVRRLNRINKREMEDLGSFILFIGIFDEDVFNDLCNRLDIEQLFELVDFENEKNTAYSLKKFHLLTYSKDIRAKIIELYSKNIEKFAIIPECLCELIPNIVIDRVKHNKDLNVELEICGTIWMSTLNALSHLERCDPAITKQIIMKNIERFKKAFLLPQGHHLKGAVELMDFFEKKYPGVLKEIFNGLDINAVEKNWSQRLRGKAQEKKVASKAVNLALGIDSKLKQMGSNLRLKFPKASTFC